jgi:hypothetical protein
MGPGMRDIIRRFGPVMGAMALSQGMNAISIAALPFLLEARWADAFALGLQVGTASLGGVVLGVVYNVALGRPGFERWKLSAGLAALFSVVLGTLVVGIAYFRDSSFTSLGPGAFIPLAAFSVGGAALACAGTGAVRSAVSGRAVPLTVINILPALLFLTSLLLLRPLELPPFLPALVWLVGTVAQIPFFWRTPPALTETAPAVEARGGATLHVAALGVGVIASTVVPTLLITALTTLPAGATVVAFLVTRIGTSLIGIGVNSILLVRYNWNTQGRDIEPAERLISVVALVPLLVAIPLALAQQSLFAISSMVVCWVISLVGSALILREVNARRMGGTIAVKVAVDVSLSLIGCAFVFASPSIPGYFALLILSQTITVLVTARALRFKAVALMAGVGTAAAVVLFVTSLLP